MKTDEELIEKTLSGDGEAFGTLVASYQDRLYRVALIIVRDAEEARDVVQETFLQAYANLSGFRKSSRFYTWLYRIAFNISVGVLRQKRRTVPVERLIDETGGEIASRGESPQERQQRKESIRILWKAIDRLPLEYRTPIVLREIDGSSYEEIAEILKIPLGTVRSRLYRARLLLKDYITRLGDDLL